MPAPSSMPATNEKDSYMLIQATFDVFSRCSLYNDNSPHLLIIDYPTTNTHLSCHTSDFAIRGIWNPRRKHHMLKQYHMLSDCVIRVYIAHACNASFSSAIALVCIFGAHARIALFVYVAVWLHRVTIGIELCVCCVSGSSRHSSPHWPHSCQFR